MFEDHLSDLFTEDIHDWLDKNRIICEFIYWNDSEDQEAPEDEDTIAFNFILIDSSGSICIRYDNGKIVEKKGHFADDLIQQLERMSTQKMPKDVKE